MRQGAFFAITTPDIDASAAWYTKHFDFAEVSRHELTERKIRMRNLTRDGAWLELIERPDAKDHGEDGVALGFFKSGFYVEDVEALHKSLTEAEVKVDHLIEDDGLKFFTLRDPDGNRLQVFELRE